MYDEDLISELVSKENYYKDSEETKKLRNKAIIMAHKHHFDNNSFYRQFCETKGIGNEITSSNFHDILIPDSVFKSYEVEDPEKEPKEFNEWVRRISSIDLNFELDKSKNLEDHLQKYDNHGLRLGFSSGTTGKLTFLPRDNYTCNMLEKSYVEAVDATVSLNKGKDYFILGIPEKTFLQVGYNGRSVAQSISPERTQFGLGELKADIIRLRMRGPRNIKDKLMNIAIAKMLPRKQDQAVKLMVNTLLKVKNERVVFLAPPYLLVEAANYVLDKNLDAKITKESFFASTGGFKGRAVTSREDMNKLLHRAFGINEGQYLDLYGMTESNSIFVECTEGNNKHVPPWIEPILFDDNMEPIIKKTGKVTGRYGFLEPSSKSFPGFIMTGDLITIDYDGCPNCSKKTPIVTQIGRAPTVEGRGCSGVLSQTAGGKN